MEKFFTTYRAVMAHCCTIHFLSCHVSRLRGGGSFLIDDITPEPTPEPTPTPESPDVTPVNPDNPETKNELAEKLLSYSDVYRLQEFIRGSSKAKKGDILLWHKQEGEDFSAELNNESYISRLNDALNNGAIIAFIDIQAQYIDKLTDSLDLDLSPYLPDNATEQEKQAAEDFYSVAIRIPSEDIMPLNSDDIEDVWDTYEYFGSDLFYSQDIMTITYTSGDETFTLNPAESELDSTDLEIIYTSGDYEVLSGDIILSTDPNPIDYNYVDDTAEDFLEWAEALDSLKAYNELVSSDNNIRTAKKIRISDSASAVFPGYSYTFKPIMHVTPRKYYFTRRVAKGETFFTYNREYKAWHRDTSMVFNIIPVHNFNDGSDYYIVKVTGETNPSQQYAHLSETAGGAILDGLGTDKLSALQFLANDTILGYNWIIEYSAQFRAGNTPVGTVSKAAPRTLNKETKKTNGETFQIDGGITGGGSAKDGAKGEISIKPSYKWESKVEYTVTDYECSSRSGGSTASWVWNFQRPEDGKRGPYATWLKDVPTSGRSSIALNSEFVVTVTKAEWQKNPQLKLYVNFKTNEGATEGHTNKYYTKWGRRDYDYAWEKNNNSEYTIPRPAHIAVTQAKFNYTATPASGHTQVVELLSELDWTATANAGWIHLTTSDNNKKTENGLESVSGSATGRNKKQVMISVDSVTDGKDRGGKIIFKASDGETCTVEILQAGK
ncbi:MAG: leukocidin family pore-forming toxin [Synergistaceae bacterium]|nr:leukocidin family pore-forming toxin [Synergistaceae bacterium]